jgi:hypothetical protein
MHAELKLRDSALMLGPENPEWKAASAKTLGNTPATLYLLVEDVDNVAAQATSAGATLASAANRHVLGRSDSHAGRSGWKQMDAGDPQIRSTPEQMDAAMKKQFAEMR